MQDPQSSRPSFGEAFRFWLKLGFISFGGPTGQIALMHTELVEKKKWIDDQRFLHALNFCMLLPGPEAQQLAIYIGWLLHRTWGGIVAGALFVIPSIFILWALSYIYVTFGSVPWVIAIFYGLKPAVLAIVAAAVIRIGSKALKNPIMWAIAAASFVAIFVFRVPFPLIIISAGLIGLFLRGSDDSSSSTNLESPKPSLLRVAKVLTVSILLWWGPVVAAAMLLGPQHTIVREGVFFSKAAMVTFGGAYAVLPYVSQQAVETHHWLSAPQMLDGLALAETTPGPLIMVLQFVGFLGGWNHPGNLSPLFAATLGAFVATWTTFVPCFLWIFLGAPYIERLRSNKLLSSALAAVTAAVVGVVLNLAVWFGMHTLFPNGAADWFAVCVAALAFVLMLRYKIDIIPIILGAGVLGLMYQLVQTAVLSR